MWGWASARLFGGPPDVTGVGQGALFLGDGATTLVPYLPDDVELALHRRHDQVVELADHFPYLPVVRFSYQVLERDAP